MRAAYTSFLDSVLIDEHTLQSRVAELGAQISTAYADCETLILICILKGGVMFMCDLARHITVPHEMDFMAVSSYGKGARQTTRSVRIEMDLTSELSGKHVLIIEDIIDSGYTLQSVMTLLQTRHPASLKLCTLLNKASRREVHVPIDFIGFEIEDKFVFGYGLDLDEKFRNLPFIGVVDPSALPA
ncbi:MAG: hypoxanthine phosphoribosyltransferase [Armatimonadetes bacterium]|nr:hypoxanthine phosphoribosyltransferase [Anaerolineae bacterium]